MRASTEPTIERVKALFPALVHWHETESGVIVGADANSSAKTMVFIERGVTPESTRCKPSHPPKPKPGDEPKPDPLPRAWHGRCEIHALGNGGNAVIFETGACRTRYEAASRLEDVLLRAARRMCDLIGRDAAL